MPDETKPPQGEKIVPVQHLVPDDLPMMFCDQVVVTNLGQHFLLRFFQTNPPVVLTDKDREGLDRVMRICRAQIVVTREHLDRLLAVIEELKARDTEGDTGDTP